MDCLTFGPVSHLDQGKYEDDAPKGKGKGKSKGKSKSKFLGSLSRLVDLLGTRQFWSWDELG